MEKNIVYAGTKEELEGFGLIAKDLNWVSSVETLSTETLHATSLRGTSLRVMAKIRYNSKTYPATISLLENNKAKVVFDSPQSAITPGQACVFYDESDEVLLGGGWIEEQLSN